MIELLRISHIRILLNQKMSSFLLEARMNELPASDVEKKVNVFRSRRKSYQFILKIGFHNIIP